MNKEANARIKINELLKEAGWRFFDQKGKKANIQLEKNVVYLYCLGFMPTNKEKYPRAFWILVLVTSYNKMS